ncbi:unnamed protein product [Blepharisma stoltei]|uniref:Ubiquitin-like domain-containing protein n=1 Tax=Blepharisma stoltei TaxID=1481888 RepID=A0AAU9IY35_9CILI|nr:unnamed protein product [Blepharisma stoltei]
MMDYPMKRSRVRLTVADKLNIIEEYEETNITLRDLADKYNIGHTSICGWLKEREKLNQSDNVNARRVSREKVLDKLANQSAPRRRKSSGKKLMKMILNRNKKVTEENEKLKSKIEQLKEEITDVKVESKKAKKEEKSTFFIYAQELSTGERKKIKIKESDTVEELKKKIKEEYPSENDRIVFAIQEMNDDTKKVGHYSVKNKSTVMII